MQKNCTQCRNEFEITDQDLAFYRQMNLPVPSTCPDCRNRVRLTLRNPQRLWKRTCAKCGNEMMTTYAPESVAVVYCEKCYKKEIYED